jgi:hypothetical protein
VSEQDGTAITADRFNGLMASYQREKARADALERRISGTEPAEPVGADGKTDSQPGTEFEDGGLYEFTDGAFAPFEPPQPGRHNEARVMTGTPSDDGSAEFAKGRLNAVLGVHEKTSWP